MTYLTGSEVAPVSVWVIEDGSYSDYRVLGVFSSSENAKRAAAVMGLDSDSVSEWPLDPGIAEMNQGLTCWHVELRPTGDVIVVKPGKFDDFSLASYPEPGYFIYRGPQNRIVADVWARGPGHAIKIVGEYRARARAKGEW